MKLNGVLKVQYSCEELQMRHQIIFIFQMQQNYDICSTKNCGKKVQASCMTCQNLKCFNCSLAHAKQYPNHQVDELDGSLNMARNKCNQLLSNLQKQYKIAREKQKESQSKKKSNSKQNDHDPKLNPEKFQEQLNYISSMEKETIKIVQKFYSELSLQLVNIWENYLNKYSNIDASVEEIQGLKKKLEQFTENSRKTQEKAALMHNYFQQNFESQVEESQKMLSKTTDEKDIPKCPDISIDQKMLISISELLCNQISTKNYQPNKQISPDEKIHINIGDSVDKNVNFLPIFPICKQFCFLYNLNDNSYQIQEFDKLQFLPAFPKSVVLWNGDIHLVGGADAKEEALRSHIVFRSTTAEVFKLANLPVARNPINGLLTRKKFIYMIGGLNQKKEWESQCFSYDLQKKQWLQISPMNNPKPHQSCAIFNNSIFCFGIPVPNNVNIQEYDIAKNKWKQIKISNFLSNPFNFAAGFTALQINPDQILLFGGKKYIENMKNKKRSTDREITPNMYVYQTGSQSFLQLQATNPCVGVRDGEVNPIMKNGKIYVAEYLISRTQPICRWLSSINILEITSSGKAESVMILHED